RMARAQLPRAAGPRCPAPRRGAVLPRLEAQQPDRADDHRPPLVRRRPGVAARAALAAGAGRRPGRRRDLGPDEGPAALAALRRVLQAVEPGVLAQLLGLAQPGLGVAPPRVVLAPLGDRAFAGGPGGLQGREAGEHRARRIVDRRAYGLAVGIEAG